MPLDSEFQKAVEKLKQSTVSDSKVLLELYSLYKQGLEGEVKGPRPGIFDPKGRAKYDARSLRRGLSQTQAKEKYIALVDKLLTR